MSKLCFISTIENTLESFVIPAAYLFKEKGHDVSLLCTMSERFVEKYNKDFHLINVTMTRGISIKDMLTKPFEFYRIFRREKFDYVQYATTNASFYAGISAKLLGTKTRVYCSWGLLYVGYEGIRRSIFRKVEQLLCSTATHITVASYKNMDVAVNDGVMPRRKCSVIGAGGTIGVNLNVFDFGKREVLKVQQEADVVVFAESLEGKEANAAKLSFSTKITDYISNGKCVMAIGKDYIAPIDYFQRNDSALIAHSSDEIKARVEAIVDNPMITDVYGEKAFNCAVRNHEKNMMNERFISTMLKAWKK